MADWMSAVSAQLREVRMDAKVTPLKPDRVIGWHKAGHSLQSLACYFQFPTGSGDEVKQAYVALTIGKSMNDCSLLLTAEKSGSVQIQLAEYLKGQSEDAWDIFDLCHGVILDLLEVGLCEPEAVWDRQLRVEVVVRLTELYRHRH